MNKIISFSPNDYTFLSLIGKGTYSKVYEAKYNKNGLLVAIKIINLEEYPLPLDTIQRQTAFWSKCNHPNILKYYGSFINGNSLWIVSEFMSGGSVHDILKFGFGKGFKDDSITASILHGVLQGLEYLHDQSEIHRDVRTGNILLGGAGEVKLSDFGLATSLIQQGTRRLEAISMYGDACYMAPEILKENAGYSEKTDIWSLGLTCFEMATGSMPYESLTYMESVVRIIDQEPPSFPKQGHCPGLKEFVDQCLVYEPKKRANAKELLENKFLKIKNEKEILTKILTQLPPLSQRYKLLYGNPEEFPNFNNDTKNLDIKQFDFSSVEPSSPSIPRSNSTSSVESASAKSEIKGRFSITRVQSNDKVKDLIEEVDSLKSIVSNLVDEQSVLIDRVNQIIVMLQSNSIK